MPSNKKILFVRLASFPGQPNLLLNLKSNEPNLGDFVENVVDLAFPAKDAPKNLTVQIQFEPFDYRGVWMDINSTLQLSQILQAVKSQSVRFSAVIVPRNETAAAAASAAGATNPAGSAPVAPVTPPARSRSMTPNALTENMHSSLPLAPCNQGAMPILSQTNSLANRTFGDGFLAPQVAAAAHASVTTTPTVPPAQQGRKRRASPSKKTTSSHKRAKVVSHLQTLFADKKSVKERIVASLAELESIGISPALRQHVAEFSGYTNVESKSFSIPLSQLEKEGFVQHPSKTKVELTPLGRSKFCSASSPPKTNDQVHECIKKLFQPQPCRIFDLLMDGKAQPRSETARALNYTNYQSKGFYRPLNIMKDLGIVQYVQDSNNEKNQIQLTDLCFPLGRP